MHTKIHEERSRLLRPCGHRGSVFEEGAFDDTGLHWRGANLGQKEGQWMEGFGLSRALRIPLLEP